jgi:hypothetical protein
MQRLARIYLGLVLAFALAVSLLALRDHLRIPFVDDWRVLDRYQSQPLAEYLFTAQNGHYLPVTLALFALDHEHLGGRMHGLVAAALACTALAAGLLHRALLGGGAPASPVARIALGFALFALVWAAGSHDLLWGLNQGSLQAVALLLLALACLGRADPARIRQSRALLAAAVLAALGASLSQSVGVASWAALVAAAAVRRFPWRVVAGLTGSAAAVVLFFAWSLPPHPRISFADSLAFGRERPFALAELVLAFVGSAPAHAAVSLGLGAPMPDAPSRDAWAMHTRDLFRLALGFGAGGLGLFATLGAWRFRRPVPRSVPDTFAIGLLAFGLGGACLVGFARAAIFGPAAAIQTRFLTWSTLFWIGAILALVPRSPERAPRPAALLAALCLPIASLGMLPALRDAQAFHATRVDQAARLALALELGVRPDELARNVSLHEAELVYRVAERLEREGRHPFDDPRRALPGSPLRERFTEAGACPGSLVRLRTVPKSTASASGGATARLVEGWLLPPAGGGRPRFVVLVDAAGLIRGLGELARERRRSERLAWAGFVVDPDAPGEPGAGAYAAWAVLADGRSACRLAPEPERRFGGSRLRDVALRDPPAEVLELLPGPAERSQHVLRPEEAAVDRVVDVRAGPAVQVLGGVRDAVARHAGPPLRGAHVQRGGKARGDPPGRLEHDGAHALDVDPGVGETVLRALEAPDLAAELLALDHVVGRPAHRRLGHAELDGREAEQGPLPDPLHDLTALRGVGRAEHRVRADAGAREHEARERLAPRRELPLERDAGGPRLDQEDSDATLAGARGHEHRAREPGRLDAGLLAVEAPARAVAAGGGARQRRVEAGRLLERGRQHRLASRDGREPPLALRLRPEGRDRHAAEHDRRQERRGCQLPPDLLEHESDLDHPEARAADLLGQRDRRQVGAAELAPEPAVVPVVGAGRTARLELLHALVAAAVGEDLARELAQRLLLVGEREVHRVPRSLSAVRGAGRDPSARRSRAGSRSPRRRRC